MGQMGYHWTKELKGQYQDGHKHVDMVEYHQKEFLPAWEKFKDCLRI